MVQTVMMQLKQDGQVVRAYTGLRLQALKDFHSNTFIDVAHGVLITGVEENSPAAEAGIRAGDILQRIDGQAVDGIYAEMLPAIWCLLADLPLDTPVSLALQRGSETFQATITPEEKGQLEGEDLDCRRWNMTVKEINKYRTPRLYYLQKKGVYIQGVKRPGNAVSSGLARRDIIVKIDGTPVETIDQVGQIYERIIADQQREKKVMFEVLRSGLRKWIVLDYRRDYDEE
jgi:serine protease Do